MSDTSEKKKRVRTSADGKEYVQEYDHNLSFRFNNDEINNAFVVLEAYYATTSKSKMMRFATRDLVTVLAENNELKKQVDDSKQAFALLSKSKEWLKLKNALELDKVAIEVSIEKLLKNQPPEIIA